MCFALLAVSEFAFFIHFFTDGTWFPVKIFYVNARGGGEHSATPGTFCVSTIMDKSLGTNLQTVTRVFIYTWSAFPPQAPTYNVGPVYTLFLQSFNIVMGGGGWGG